MTEAATADDCPKFQNGDQGPVLAVQGVSRSYGERCALSDVDLELHSGEVYGLLGPNGAGKTSLVRAISGRLRLDAGSVRLCGFDPARDPSARRMLGLVPQEIALYSDLTARENLEVFGRLLGVAANEVGAAAHRLLDQIGLAERADEQVANLSGGMKRRLNVAVGVIHHPRVLLLDEPTVGVDPAARERIHELLLDLRREGLAILLTTHDMDQATELADRVGMLIDGRLQAEGGVPELIREVFGDSKELIVSFRQPPSTEGCAHLEAEGFEESRDRRVWISRLTVGRGDVAVISEGLQDAGLDVEEIRVREPGLRGVFFRLAGREIDA